MNIKKLKELIEQLPDDMPVILQPDSEGNSYLAANNAVQALLKSPGEILLLDWTARDVCMEPSEWEELKAGGRKCLVIEP